MAIRNQNWYNLGESTPYPLEGDVATLLCDNGIRFPTHIVCDLNLRFPSTLGQYAYISACTVTSKLVTIVILASKDPTLAVDPAPLAVVTLLQPIDHYRPYAVEALTAGVGGWIVFGGGADEDFSGRFSTPAQTLLSPRAACAYTPFPVAGIGRYGGGVWLEGVVRLHGGNDIEIVHEQHDTPVDPDPGSQTVLRDVAVIRLKDKSLGPLQRNTLALYAGPCGGRPESHSCNDPQPIETLGAVEPDCCGNITLILRGCAEISEVAREAVLDDLGEIVYEDVACGIIVDCGIGLTDNCHAKDRLPDSTGLLPGGIDFSCASVSLDLSESIWYSESTQSESVVNDCQWNNGISVLQPDPVFVEFDPDQWRCLEGSIYYLGSREAGVVLNSGAGPYGTTIYCYSLAVGTACRYNQAFFEILPSALEGACSMGILFAIGNTPGDRSCGWYVAQINRQAEGAATFELRQIGETAEVLIVYNDIPNLVEYSAYCISVRIGRPADNGETEVQLRLVNVGTGILVASFSVTMYLTNVDGFGEGLWALRAVAAQTIAHDFYIASNTDCT